MSTARMGGKSWADVGEDDDDDFTGSPKSRTRFETQPDENGIKTVIEYNNKDGKTYKVQKKVRVVNVTTRTNQAILERRKIPKFGKPATADPAGEKLVVKQQDDEIFIELTKKLGTQTAATKDEAEDKFFEESLALAEGMQKEKKAWTDLNRERQVERDATGTRETAEVPADVAATDAALAARQPGAYVPPSLRGAQAGGKGGGKGDFGQQQEASLRITNLSEDVREGDLQDLFGQFGRLQRVFLVKDPNTYQCRGSAFVTYYNRDDAQRAMNKLNGHGYDNLILTVQWAKPRA